MLLEQLLEQSARRYPQKTALVCGGLRYTYSELDGKANQLAHSLVASGVVRGDRVAIYLENSIEAVLSIFAVLKAGAVFVVVNPSTKVEKLTYLLNHCRAVAAITDSVKLKAAGDAWVTNRHLRAIWVAGAAPALWQGQSRVLLLNDVFASADSTSQPPKRSISLDLAALMYTSGSTGKPKGVMATHLSLLSAMDSIATYLEHTESDVIASVLPLAFGYGLCQMFVTFKTGGTLILERSFTYPYAVLAMMAREGVTGFALVPTIAAILLQLNLEDVKLPRLRYITNAAAALPVLHIQKLRALWPHVKIFSMYGQTECIRISYLEPTELEARPGSVGRGIPNQEVWLEDENGKRVRDGGVGTLVVRGAHVARGYWDDPETTRRTFRPGLLCGEQVLHTGDLFRMDADGYLYFVSRRDDIIKTRGEKVSPREVEDVLHGIAGIAEAAVIGVTDPVLGQAVKAFIRLQEGAVLTERQILRQSAQQLEDFMVPKYVEFLQEMPKNANGKIDKRELASSSQNGVTGLEKTLTAAAPHNSERSGPAPSTGQTIA